MIVTSSLVNIIAELPHSGQNLAFTVTHTLRCMCCMFLIFLREISSMTWRIIRQAFWRLFASPGQGKFSNALVTSPYVIVQSNRSQVVMCLNMTTKFLHLSQSSKILWLCFNPKGMITFLFHDMWQKLSAFVNYVVQLFMKIQSTIYTSYTHMSGAYNRNSFLCSKRITKGLHTGILMTHITQLSLYCLQLSRNELVCYKSNKRTEYTIASSMILDSLEAVSKISYQYVNSHYKDKMVISCYIFNGNPYTLKYGLYIETGPM